MPSYPIEPSVYAMQVLPALLCLRLLALVQHKSKNNGQYNGVVRLHPHFKAILELIVLSRASLARIAPQLEGS
ncbi:hypothetical protein HYFRA_00007826 [Hymenoscyphus fraxineus]|uniref:Uncharacterized protein n=1 Tax=Hymenoscyphus fraxineus TaxID=746836 RepID=A0A9N9KM94_9HELO|nr:hypothetical protein HYFRA_00007826 [Hymenoscyphus fraxineus]